jgi:hypothetical protein
MWRVTAKSKRTVAEYALKLEADAFIEACRFTDKTFTLVEIPCDAGFSIACVGCDRDDIPTDAAEAYSLGWREIIYDDGAAWNWLGMCPDCIKLESEELNEHNKKAVVSD